MAESCPDIHIIKRKDTPKISNIWNALVGSWQGFRLAGPPDRVLGFSGAEEVVRQNVS
jgi:hypothetical protein